MQHKLVPKTSLLVKIISFCIRLESSWSSQQIGPDPLLLFYLHSAFYSYTVNKGSYSKISFKISLSHFLFLVICLSWPTNHRSIKFHGNPFSRFSCNPADNQAKPRNKQRDRGENMTALEKVIGSSWFQKEKLYYHTEIKQSYAFTVGAIIILWQRLITADLKCQNFRR